MNAFAGNLTPRNNQEIPTGGGIGFVNPMPSGTILEGTDKDDNIVPVAGYAFESVVVGDYLFGNQLLLVSTDDFATFSTFVTIGDTGFSTNTEIGGNEMSLGYNIANKESEIRYETPSLDTLGMTHRDIMLSELSADDDILHTYTSEGANDTQNNVNYFKREVFASTVGTGNESSEIRDSVMVGGSEILAQTINGLGIINRVATNQDAVVFTTNLGTVCLSFLRTETNLATGTYGVAIAAGATVPADGDTGPSSTPGFVAGAQFIRLTGGDAEIYLNLGNSTSCKFRKITTS